MKFLKRYRIPFTGLKNDQHEFDFDVDKRFFDEFEYSIVKDGKLKVVVNLEKQETMMILKFNIEGYISLDCDLCLNTFPGNLIINERLIVKFQEVDNLNELTEDIIVLSKQDYEIDIAPILYEYINVAVPINSRCDNPGNNAFCDKGMVEKIKSLKDNKEANKQNDPRWDILKKIKNN